MVANPFYISPEDYLEGERVSPIKHEYRRGHSYALVGTNKPHAIISGNIAALLGNHLEDSPCIVMSSDIKVRLETADCYYYPDVVITYHPDDLVGDEDYIHHPKLVIEVLSKSTEKFDKGEKFSDYQTCPELEEYVLVSQTELSIEVRSRIDNTWQTTTYQSGQSIKLHSIGWEGEVSAIYRKVKFSSQTL